MTTAALTANQLFVLRVMCDGRPVHTGRRGYPVATLRALERRGLVRVASVHTWETNWRLTDAGYSLGRSLSEARELGR